MKLIAYLVAFMLLLGCRTLAFADGEIIVKGLAKDRAILAYQGQLLVLKKGQQKLGIKLLEANEEQAIIQQGEKKLYLFLDQSIAKSYQKPKILQQQHKPQILYRQSQYIHYQKSRIVSLVLQKQSHNSIELELEYFYDGKYGSNADFVVSVINKGRLQEEINKQYYRLEKGQNKVSIRLDMSHSDKMVFYSEAINIAFLSRREKTAVFYTKTIKFEKYWQKVRVR